MTRLNAFVALSMLATACTAGPGENPRPAAPPALAKIDFPAYEKTSLPNGLTIYVLEHREQPVVSVRLAIRAGSRSDPDSLPGLAAFTTSLLDKGTETRTAPEIADFMDRSGGSLSASSDTDSVVISAAGFAENLGLTLEMLADVTLRPTFAPAEIERQRQQAISNHAANLEDPAFVADMLLQRAMYGRHPYSHPEGGTLPSIRAFARADLVAFHRSRFSPDAAALIVAGDVQRTDVLEAVQRHFGQWRASTGREERPPQPASLNKPRIIVVDKPDSVQTEVRVGVTTVGRRDASYFPLLFASQILGGGSSSRLFRTLRVERGLTYGAFAFVQPRPLLGAFVASTQTRTEKTREALDLMLQEIERFNSTVPPATELDDAKAYIIGGFPLTLETPADLATRLSNVFLFDLGDDYLRNYRDRLNAVTAEEVGTASRAHLVKERMSIVLVGQAAGFRESLTSFGEVQSIPIDRADGLRP